MITNETVAGIPYLAGAVAVYLDELERRAQGDVRHLSTGLADLDRTYPGLLYPGSMTVIGGRPSSGKTTLAQQIAEHAGELNVTVLIISLEMPHQELLERSISRRSGIPVARLRVATDLAQEDYERITRVVSQISMLPILVCTANSLTEILARSRAVAAELAKSGNRLGLIALDYIQLVNAGGRSGGDRVQEVSRITRSLKLLAMELDLPLIALSQLNRGLEQRPNKRPVLSDLRESGSIEQDADSVVFIYRDEVYNEDSQDKGTAELIVAKNRHGAVGKTQVAFLPDKLMFADLAHREDFARRAEPRSHKAHTPYKPWMRSHESETDSNDW